MQTHSERGGYMNFIHFKAVYIEKKQEENLNSFFNNKTMLNR